MYRDPATGFVISTTIAPGLCIMGIAITIRATRSLPWESRYTFSTLER
jgi:hypothetical protein